MVNFSLQLKPVGSDCNLKCSYCYAEPFKTGRVVLMGREVLEKAISECLRQNKNPSITWHGGEPTLAGIDFFNQSQELIDYYRQPNQKVTQILQTNATLITSQLAQFFADKDFEIGVSLDGPEEINDINRRDYGEKGSFSRIMVGVKTLRQAGVEPSVIVTVDASTLPYARNVMGFLIGQDFTRIKFSPVYDPGRDRFNISSDQWFEYLDTVFDVWMENGDPEISISELDEVIAWLEPDKAYPMCSSNHTCINWVSIDPDGTMYPCSYFRSDAYGNILSIPLEDVVKTVGYLHFRKVFTTLPIGCQQCRFKKVCGNGCSATRVNQQGLIDPSGTYVYCNERKRLFQKIQKAFIDEKGGE